ncbi:hypothetical protein Hamer_G018406 [Homarus americanus]|uniref:Uncharacterized protein n=1 Tax=Homarus americanus TaxID=6706 RepID=A0A8J5MY89_HOMAM|nr:hypothetical protein Hamer_G018406 [Homarus americanus]
MTTVRRGYHSNDRATTTTADPTEPHWIPAHTGEEEEEEEEGGDTMAEENITNLLPRRPVIIKREKRKVLTDNVNKNFGRIPTYLQRRKEQLQQEGGGATAGAGGKEVQQQDGEELQKEGSASQPEGDAGTTGLTGVVRPGQNTQRSPGDKVNELARYIFLLRNYTVALT